MENTKTSLMIPRDILKQAKIQAVQEEISFGELVRRALKEYLDKRAGSPKGKAKPWIFIQHQNYFHCVHFSRKRKGGIMEGRRKIIISIALVVIIMMGVFPPWVEKFSVRDFQLERPIGYGFISSPPETTNNKYSLSIDFSRLFLQWGVVILMIGLCIFLSRKWGRDWKNYAELMNIWRGKKGG